MANNEVTTEYILPVIQAGTSVDSDVIELTATDQQVITAYSRSNENAGIATFDAGGKTFFSVIVLANPAGLSGQEKQTNACITALRDWNINKNRSVMGSLAFIFIPVWFTYSIYFRICIRNAFSFRRQR